MRWPAADLEQEQVIQIGEMQVNMHEYTLFLVRQTAEMTHTHPVPDVKETLLIGQVKHQQETHGISEESCREAAEPESRWTAFVFYHNAGCHE